LVILATRRLEAQEARPTADDPDRANVEIAQNVLQTRRLDR
jgi:hypothetical protein